MTVRQIFSLIGGGIVAFLFAILGIQQKKIVKQKEEIKEAEIAQTMLNKNDWMEAQLGRYERLYGKGSIEYQTKLQERLSDLEKRESWEWTIKEYRRM